MPRPETPGAGFHILKNAQHTTIFAPEESQGAFNHHARLTWFEGLFHAMWSNHPLAEDGPGQRILMSTSPDGAAWTASQELFPSPGPVTASMSEGLVLTAFGWYVLEGRLYALAGFNENAGFTDVDHALDPVPVWDRDHPKRARRGHPSLGREVCTGPALSPVFTTHGPPLADLSFACCPDLTHGALRAACSAPLRMPPWDFEGIHQFPRAAGNGHRLCEPATFPDKDGRIVMLLRDCHWSHRMYVSHWDASGRRWLAAEPTDIPDSPSQSTASVLPDGTVLLVGNQMAPAFDNANEIKSYPRDPLTVAVSKDGKGFTECFALRLGEHAFRVPHDRVKGRHGGAQYPSAIVRDSRLYVLYSMGKEDICVSSVALTELELRGQMRMALP